MFLLPCGRGPIPSQSIIALACKADPSLLSYFQSFPTTNLSPQTPFLRLFQHRLQLYQPAVNDSGRLGHELVGAVPGLEAASCDLTTVVGWAAVPNRWSWGQNILKLVSG